MSKTELPKGFQVGGVTCGIKESGQSDLALFIADQDTVGAGVFTQNQVVGAPVIVSRERVPSNNIRGVVINSGNSNACTGERGLTDAREMTRIVAEQFDIAAEQILVCSTGVIGHFLPMDKIGAGIRAASEKLGTMPEDIQRAAKAIMTTDTVEKISCRQIMIDGLTVKITGVAKGAAMIAPNMATMLSVIMTDIALNPGEAHSSLTTAVNQSFNNIVVEGHTSTSDTVLLLGSGMSGVQLNAANQSEFQTALNEVAGELSQMIIRDAEGAGHFVTVKVSGLPTDQEARKIAKAICEGPLVKTAITGNDPNWGRIVSAAGYAGVTFREEDVSLVLNNVLIYEHGVPVEYDEAALSESMRSGEVTIDLQFRLGTAEVTYWTCDLTAEYIRLNADYTT